MYHFYHFWNYNLNFGSFCGMIPAKICPARLLTYNHTFWSLFWQIPVHKPVIIRPGDDSDDSDDDKSKTTSSQGMMGLSGLDMFLKEARKTASKVSHFCHACMIKICDTIKGNESHVTNFQFQFFSISYLSILNASFWSKPHLSRTSGCREIWRV